jgi:hypothetical protein
VPAIYQWFMALLFESVDFKKLDVRMVERNLARGVIDAHELEAAVKELPDDSENADWVSVESLAHEPGEGMNGKASHQH